MDIFQVDRGIWQSISQFPQYGIIMMLQNSLGDRRQNTVIVFSPTLPKSAPFLVPAEVLVTLSVEFCHSFPAPITAIKCTQLFDGSDSNRQRMGFTSVDPLELYWTVASDVWA